MLPRISPQAIVLASAVHLMMMGGLMLVIAYVNRTVPGIRRCGLGTLIMTAALGGFLLRNVISADWLLLVSHAAVLAGLTFVCHGVRTFRGKPALSPWLIAIGFSASLAGCAYGLYVLDSLTFRVASMSPYLAVMLLLSAAAMATGVAPRDRPVYWATALAFGVGGCLMLVRTVETCFVKLGTDYTDLHILEVINILGANLSGSFAILGLFLSINLQLQRKIESLLLFDPLTGLPNRRHFDQQYHQAIASASRDRRRLALVFMDLNGFKDINDQLGHEAGDEALRVVAARLLEVVRQSDCLVRIAGDEFVLLLENVGSREEVVKLIKRIGEVVAREVELAGHYVSLAISCGYAIYPDDVADVSQLMRQADRAMYAAKHGSLTAPGMLPATVPSTDVRLSRSLAQTPRGPISPFDLRLPESAASG